MQCPRPARGRPPPTQDHHRGQHEVAGNPGYVKTTTNVDRHRDVKYRTEKAASLIINDRLFRQLDVVVEDAYEIEMNKKTVKYTWDSSFNSTPRCACCSFITTLSTFTWSAIFQYCEMDTDSAYLGLAGESVDDLMTPEELRKHYFRHRS